MTHTQIRERVVQMGTPPRGLGHGVAPDLIRTHSTGDMQAATPPMSITISRALC